MSTQRYERMTPYGRSGEVTNGRLSALRFAKPGFGWLTALETAVWPERVVETHSLTVGSVIRRCQFANGSNPTWSRLTTRIAERQLWPKFTCESSGNILLRSHRAGAVYAGSLNENIHAGCDLGQIPQKQASRLGAKI